MTDKYLLIWLLKATKARVTFNFRRKRLLFFEINLHSASLIHEADSETNFVWHRWKAVYMV